MSGYAAGAHVLIRDEEWMVLSAEPSAHGGYAVRVVGLSELVRNKEAVFLTARDDVLELAPEKTALVHDDSPRYRRSRLYLEALLRRSPPTEPHLYAGPRGAIDRAPYQWVPATKALEQLRPRILMADGVGLGKTIQVGILLSELIRRGRGRRILVVALKSILAQFQKELWARFTIPLVRLDSQGIQRVQARIPANMNPFHSFDRVIVSIDTLKKHGRYRAALEQCHWDVIVIDECQNVADKSRAGTHRRSQRADLARLLARTSDALILTSATPHDGRPESFASLLNLLDPTAVADPEQFTKDEVAHLYVRRFQKDVRGEVSGAFREREVHLDRVDATPEEDAALVAIHEARFHTLRADNASEGALFRTTLLKAFLSSPLACLETLENRRARIGENATGEAAADRATLDRLIAACRAIPRAHVSKLDRLVAWLRSIGWKEGREGERVVLFSERLATLAWLEAELAAVFGVAVTRTRTSADAPMEKGAIARFHGGTPDHDQYEILADFGAADGKIRILLCSDAAAEGLNLHYACHRLVHFDVPWSLITLEQRNGRIDRYGQEHRPEIRYLLSQPRTEALRGDNRVLEVLIAKETEASRNLGDVAWLLRLHSAEKESERIAQLIERGEDPEAALASPPPAEDDWFADLLSLGAETPAAPQARDPLALYADLPFAKDAFAELNRADPTVEVPEWLDLMGGFRLRPSKDLAHRYGYLPPELRKADEIKLTVDRTRVANALALARKMEDRWPEWELFWEQHPVAEWLHDRVLALYARHEAPVLRVRGLAQGDVAWVFQGVVSNQRSQPLLVDWFAVRDGKAEPFAALAAATGLTEGPPNPGVGADLAALSAGLPAAVEAARTHMRERRHARDAGLADELRAQERRVRDWAERAKARIGARQETMLLPRSDLLKRLDDERRHVDDLLAERRAWIAHTLRSSPEPYLRLAAVLLPLG